MKKPNNRIYALLTAVVLSLFPAASLHSQDRDFSGIRLNGLDIYGQYTESEMIAAFGEPDDTGNAVYGYFVYEHVSNVESVRGSGEVKTVRDEIGYDRDADTGKYRIAVFFINSDRIELNGYIRVGDPVSKVSDMGGKTKEVTERSGERRLYWVPEGGPEEPYIEWDCYPYFLYGEDGTIKSINLYYD